MAETSCVVQLCEATLKSMSDDNELDVKKGNPYAIILYTQFFYMTYMLYSMVRSLYIEKRLEEVNFLVGELQTGKTIDDISPTEKRKKFVSLHYNQMVSKGFEISLPVIYWLYYYVEIIYSRIKHILNFFSNNSDGTELGTSEAIPQLADSQDQPRHPRLTSWERTIVITGSIVSFSVRLIDFTLRLLVFAFGFVQHIIFGMRDEVVFVDEIPGADNVEVPFSNQVDVMNAAAPTPSTPPQVSLGATNADNTGISSDMFVHYDDVYDNSCEPVILNKPQTPMNKVQNIFKKPSKYLSFRLTRKINSSTSTVATTSSTVTNMDDPNFEAAVKANLMASPSFNLTGTGQISTSTSSSSSRSGFGSLLSGFGSPSKPSAACSTPIANVSSKDSSNNENSHSSSSHSSNHSQGSLPTPSNVVTTEGCTPHNSCILS